MTPFAIRYVLVVLIVVAAVSDIRSRRIPNWLSLGGVVAGLGLNLVSAGLHGLGQSALGLLTGFTLYFALYALHAMGAGDVKLMGAIGALVGPWNWVVIFLITAIAGGIVALGVVLMRGRARRTLWNIGSALNEILHLRSPHGSFPELDVKSGRATRLPHAVPIAIGSLLFVLGQAGGA